MDTLYLDFGKVLIRFLFWKIKSHGVGGNTLVGLDDWLANKNQGT